MGLIKTGLKAAVAVKTAHYVHERIERRQQADWAGQGQQPPGAPGAAPYPGPHAGYAVAPGGIAASAPVATPPVDQPPAAGAIAGQDRSAVLSQLKDLGELKTAGVLTEEEFLQQKALILGA